MRDEARPFRVEVRLAAPVSLNHPWLHLDGILAHLAVLQWGHAVIGVDTPRFLKPVISVLWFHRARGARYFSVFC